MSDECLMKQEFGFSFYTQYQAVMRKFTLAGKSLRTVRQGVNVMSEIEGQEDITTYLICIKTVVVCTELIQTTHHIVAGEV